MTPSPISTISADATPAAVRPSGTPRHLIVIGLAAVLAVGTAVASLFFGGRPTEGHEIVASLRGQGDPYIDAVGSARLARTVMGALVGSALAVAGLLIQHATRNPLGDPGLLGVTTGASAALVTGAAISGRGFGANSLGLALIGALITVTAVYAIGGRSGTKRVESLLLTGAVVTAVLGAYIQAMALKNPAIFEPFRFWVIGALAGRDVGVAATVAPIIGLGFVIAVGLTPSLNNLALGDEVAQGLGVRVGAVRAGAILAAALLSGAATAAVGPVAFIGLAVPHLSRSVIDVDLRWQLPMSALIGAALLIGADVVGRVVARPHEIMVGIVTALIGAPFLLMAVRRGWASR